MAEWIGSPAFTKGRQGKNVQKILIHWMVGTLASTDAVFKSGSRGTSAHYGIEDGNVHQYVKEEDTAYHAGEWNANLTSIGIEHSAAPGRPATQATYDTSIRLCADICRRYGLNPDVAIVPHNSVVATQCPGTMDLNKIKQGVKNIIAGGAIMELVNKGDIDNIYPLVFGRAPDDGAYGYVGMDWKKFAYTILMSPEYTARIDDFKRWKAAGMELTRDRDRNLYPLIESQKAKIASLEAELAARPVGGISAEDSAAIKETNGIVKSIFNKITSIFK